MSSDRFQPIYDIAELCARKNVTQAVLCPGSRNAPLILAFARHPLIRCRTISDERSAAFIALGMAQQTRIPTVLVCTSGSAAFNFSPAIAEAYFSKTPLVVITADRPSEWIAQQDGQTIYQEGIYGSHVKQCYRLPQEFEHPDNGWAINRILNEAINLSLQEPCGPVHINAPFREPLYPSSVDNGVRYSENVRVIQEMAPPAALTEDHKAFVRDHWQTFRHVVLVGGQQDPDPSRIQSLSNLLSYHSLPVIGDVLSNLHGLPTVVRHQDLFLSAASDEVKKTLQPDLLITFGDSVISKNLKIFLRDYPAKAHWHIQPAGRVADTYKGVTQVFRVNPNSFFNFLSGIPRREGFENQKQNNYTKLWEVEERRAMRTLGDFFIKKDFGEFEVVSEILQNLPADCNLHLANSMSVRYANFIGLTETQGDVNVYSNRGTSGIDGCTSSAVGHTLQTTKLNILITGDLAFFYDRNAFWHNYPLPNLRVVLLNNHGGIIFKMIDGPGAVPEADEFFITDQKLNAKKLCEEFNFEYLKLDGRRKIKNLVRDLFEDTGKTAVLEFESSQGINKALFEDLKMKMRQSYEL